MARQPDPIKYKFDADTRDFARGTKQVVRDLQGVERQAQRTDKQLDLELDLDTSSLDVLRERLRAARAGLVKDLELGVEVDTVKAVAQIQRIERQLRQLDRVEIKPEVDIDVDRGFAGIVAGLDAARDGVTNLTGTLKALPPQAQLAVAGVGLIGGALAAPLAVGTVGGVIAGLGAAAGVGLLSAFDELEKATRKAKIVFGAQLADMQAWAEGVSYNVGLGSREVLAGASAIQDLLKPRGFSEAEAARITQAVYERGAAIAEFSGRDTLDGIDAVSKSLLGQGKSLTMMGVEIRKTDVKKWIRENADEVAGLNDKQAEVVATLALIEANSKDAWRAYQEGAGVADEVLDKFAAAAANVKDALVRGFGGIFVGVVDDVLAVSGAFGGIEDAAGNLTDWIDANEDKIRSWLIDLADYALLGAQAFGETAKAMLTVVEYAMRTVPDFMRFSAGAIDLSEKVGALFTLLNSDLTEPAGRAQFSAAWEALTSDASKRVTDLEDAADRLEEKLNGFDLSGGKDAIDGFVDTLGGVRDTLEALRGADAARIEIEAALKAKDVAEVERILADLTADELVALIASLDPKSESKTERKIRELAEDRYATIYISWKGYNIPKYLASPDLLPGGRALVPQAGGMSRAAGAAEYVTIPARVSTRAVNVSIVNNYPEPERASESLAMSLRLVREAVA